jgi:hypothetical protein
MTGARPPEAGIVDPAVEPAVLSAAGCTFLPMSMKWSTQLSCHSDSLANHQKRGCSVDSSPLKAANNKGKV